MGLTSALGIGRTALAAYQAALQVAGNNIANVDTPGYTRNIADLSAIPGANIKVGQLGNGVFVSGVRRSVSEALNARLRTAVSDQNSARVETNNLDRMEGIYDPLGNINLGTLMAEFFEALSDLQNNPEDFATRGLVINSAQTLAQRIRDIRGDMIELHDDLNSEISTATKRADELATQIAALNVQITTAEAGNGGQAAALRDERDQLLSELSEIFEITVREQPGGAINVYVGNESLIQFGQSFGMQAVQELDANGIVKTVPKFKHNNGTVTARSGQVEGLIKARDTHFDSQLARLDTLASGLIWEINTIHAGGTGLDKFTSITSIESVFDPTLALNAADNGLTFTPKTGSFFIDVKDSSGSVVRTQINVDLDGIGTDTTLNSLAADITAKVAGVTATVLANGQLKLTASAGLKFSFADDTSHTLAALGINTFFTGSNSIDIDVNSLVSSNPNLIAAARSDLPGDSSNVTAMTLIQESGLDSMGGVSLNDYYTTTMAELAVQLSGAKSAYEASSAIFDSLTVQRESISGVNLDEEAVALMQYQRAYEGAARYMMVVDEMMQTLLGLVR